MGALVSGVLAGCASPGYYLHLLDGQRELLSGRVAVADVLADPARDPALKQRLSLVQDARRFASDELRLPKNGSYSTFVDLHRDYVVWNVFATPEFSLEARQWCHLLVGCVAYRGYYGEAQAKDMAAQLRRQGFDVHVGGVPAYSTLGWFDDPVVSSMLHWDDDHLVGTVFHELAHQKYFAAGDTAFNESFASFVEEEGLRQFRARRGEPMPSALSSQREQQFVQLVFGARQQLEQLYRSGLPADALRAGKRAAIAQLRAGYEALRAEWGGYPGYDAWFAGDINNAKLLPVGLYHKWVPAFAALWQQKPGDWNAFFGAVGALAKSGPEQRVAQLDALISEVASRE